VVASGGIRANRSERWRTDQDQDAIHATDPGVAPLPFLSQAITHGADHHFDKTRMQAVRKAGNPTGPVV